MANLISILWNYWDSRNNFMFKGQVDKAHAIWDRASNLGKEFRIYNLLYAPMRSQNDNMKKWDKPPKGVVKINFDATVNGDRVRYGVIFLDNDDFVLSGGGFHR
ncbi:hypothetical protein PVK06_040432 [Gossypium arboreum]|uniref:Uncharacterized protein n=1 Tax=Gossypium arboreum TaxID=29729 RepID=A0ABR0N5D5_GOSAR|nr:hypothetical protein PVK06_040432 [Gossypium arboreum]